jgi:hypothetical protein
MSCRTSGAITGRDMTACEVANYHFGYPTYIARVSKKYPFDNYRFMDTGGSICEEDRPCPKCHQHRTAEGHDPCIANLPDVQNACCGHGRVGDAYVMFTTGENGLRGQQALDWFAARKAAEQQYGYSEATNGRQS